MPFDLLQLFLGAALRQVALQVEHHPGAQEFAVVLLRQIQHLVGLQRFVAEVRIAVVVVAQRGGDLLRHLRQQQLFQRFLVQRIAGVAHLIAAEQPHAVGERRIVQRKVLAVRQVQQAVEERQQREHVAVAQLRQVLPLALDAGHLGGHFRQIGLVVAVAGEPEHRQHRQDRRQRDVTRPVQGAVAVFPPAVAARQPGFLEDHRFQRLFQEEALALGRRDWRFLAHAVPGRVGLRP